jgi:hypothetical protein
MLYSQSPPLADDDATQEDTPHEFGRDRDARPEPRFGRRSAPMYAAPPRPSIGRRMFRGIARFAIVLAIGLGGTLGWQAYSAWQSNAASARASLAIVVSSSQAAGCCCSRPRPALQLEPLAANLASNIEFVRRGVGLALKQEQMARSIRRCSVDEHPAKVSAVAAPIPAQPMTAIPQPKPAAPKPPPPPGAPVPRPSTRLRRFRSCRAAW